MSSPLPSSARTLADLVATHRAVVCVGTGGVGKTTTAASLGLAGAMLGKKTMVITIDPARQLARALGLQTLKRGGERVPPEVLAAAGLDVPGELHAGMLDQKGAWDAFISRHAADPSIRDTLLNNSFYQQLSTSFAGSTEFMAVEELCRIDESGEYELIIVDTPPAGHAIDFLKAPERIESLLDPEVASWLAVPYRALSASRLQLGSMPVQFALQQLEKAMGASTIREVSAFFVALDAIFGNVAQRAKRSRALLLGPSTAFVLVASPKARVLADGAELAATMRGMGVPLKGAIINRVHTLPDAEEGPEAVLEELGRGGVDADSARWLESTYHEARVLEGQERARLEAFGRGLPPGTVWTEVPELDHDAHSLQDLAALAHRWGVAGGAPPGVSGP